MYIYDNKFCTDFIMQNFTRKIVVYPLEVDLVRCVA